MTEKEALRFERLALLIGTMMGQLSELLNKISNQQVNNTYIYHSLIDIQKMASLQINEIYYKNNKP